MVRRNSKIVSWSLHCNWSSVVRQGQNGLVRGTGRWRDVFRLSAVPASSAKVYMRLTVRPSQESRDQAISCVWIGSDVAPGARWRNAPCQFGG